MEMHKRALFLLKQILTVGCFTLFASSACAKDVIADAGLFTVKIFVTIAYPFEKDSKGTSIGAGFLVDRDRGWILTNAHVAGRSPSLVQVSFNHHPFRKAEKLYVDNHLDVAILKIDPSKIPPDVIASSLQCASEYAPGRPVFAFGHPWSLDYTATRGIISGIGVSRGVEVLQIDAALNPGNSGGPLIDAETGTIVGVNAASAGGSQGLNFAVPIKLVCTIVDLLKQGKDPAPPVLPFLVATTMDDNDLLVAKVNGEGSPAFKIGDRILAIDGERPIHNLSRVLDHMRGKDRVVFTIGRNATEQQVAFDIPKAKNLMRRRGVQVSGMTIARRFIPESEPNDMYVHFVDGSSLADQAGFSVGDRIMSIDGLSMNSFDAVLNALRDKAGKETEIVVKHEYSSGYGRYDYTAMELSVNDVFEVTEGGPIP